jgi:hypothetical protein
MSEARGGKRRKSMKNISKKTTTKKLENGLKNIRTVLIVKDRKVSLKNNIVNMVVKNKFIHCYPR